MARQLNADQRLVLENVITALKAARYTGLSDHIAGYCSDCCSFDDVDDAANDLAAFEDKQEATTPKEEIVISQISATCSVNLPDRFYDDDACENLRNELYRIQEINRDSIWICTLESPYLMFEARRGMTEELATAVANAIRVSR